MRRLLLAAALALAGAGCVTDPYGDPVPGRDATGRLAPGAPPLRVRWPVAYRRGARFAVENATGVPVETVLLDFWGEGSPEAIEEIEVESPAGGAVRLLPAPHPQRSVRALFGEPGTVLLEPGATLVFRVRVDGVPGSAVATFTVPDLTK